MLVVLLAINGLEISVFFVAAIAVLSLKSGTLKPIDVKIQLPHVESFKPGMEPDAFAIQDTNKFLQGYAPHSVKEAE